MANVDLTNLWGSGIDMSDFTEDGWGYLDAGALAGYLSAGDNTVNFATDNSAAYDSVIINYYYDDVNDYTLVRDIYYYQGSDLVQTLEGVNIEAPAADLDSSAWYVRFNQGNDQFIGNDYADFIKGGYGDDVLMGYAGADQLYGNDGNDTLSGGSDSDLLVGGWGYDTAVFAGSSGEYAFALNDDGSVSVTDLVGAGGTDDLYDIEAVSFTDGTFSIDSFFTVEPPSDPYTGDDSPNTLIGDSGSNWLKGFGGNDVLKGGAGADYLYGGTGNDVLTGGRGKDFFVFDTKPNALRNADKITDFRPADDTICLDNAVFKKVGANGALKAGAFYANMTGKAHDASDRVIFEKDTGKLFYDADGTGKIAPVLFATLTNKVAVTVKDFYVI